MTAAEEIHAAIEKLTALKSPGPWKRTGELWDGSGRYDIEDGNGSLITADGDGIGSIHNILDADLIVTLHATIDAQLSILRGALKAAEFSGSLYPASTYDRANYDLARAINGATS